MLFPLSMAAKMWKTNAFLQFLFLLVFFHIGNSAKLTVPRILLPYNTGVPTNYTLEVKNGNCYKWSSSRYDLVSIVPLPLSTESDSCTTKVIVSSVSRYSERDSAIILAEDERSGQVLRCDVVIDAIHSIEIVTTTRVLFLEDAPEVFEVIAKNDQGDTFSSLEGVAFRWAVDSDTYANDAHGVLRFLKFAESEYKTPPAIEYWEKQNLHGSLILMEGSKTGSAKVTVKPMDLSYKDVASYEVSLVIVANLNLRPTHIYILPGTEVKYYLELIKQGKFYPVSLPSEQYYLDVSDLKVLSLDGYTSTVTALDYGMSSVLVKDRYVTDREIAYLPSAVVHVTVPSYMTFSIQPGDKWSLQEEYEYIISINIFDRNSYPIHITKEVKVDVNFPEKYFTVISSEPNGTYHKVYTKTHGSCQITAKLTGIGEKDQFKKLEIPITATQEATIYAKITVSPTVTLLPWDAFVKPSYLVNLTATGGTGSYKWMSSKTSMATVKAATVQSKPDAQVVTSGEGVVLIHAADSHISSFSGSAIISIQNAVSMALKPKEVEVFVNETLHVPMVMHGYLKDGDVKELMFSDCSQLPLLVDVHEVPKFDYLQESAPFTSATCRTLKFSCFSPGYNRIRVQYKKNDDYLRASIVVGCYKPLKLSHPFVETVTALGSSLDVIFEGGSKPWPNCHDSFHAELTADDSVIKTSSIENSTEDTGHAHMYRAVCVKYGDSNVDLLVGNKPCPSNPYPISSKASAKIFCAEPQTIVISTGSLASGPKCPSSADEMISIHNSQDVVLGISVTDSFGRPLYNISSLIIKWQVSNKALANLDTIVGFQTTMVQRNGHQAILKNYQELHPFGIEGNVKVTATIVGYKPEFLQMYDINLKPDLPTAISHTVSLKFVEEVELSPRWLSLFNNPSNKGEINITKGSGYFNIDVSEPNIARVVYYKDQRRLEVEPLNTGSFTVTIHDLCVSMKRETVAQIQIYGISTILLDVIDKVELGKSILASVEVLNEDKKNIPASVFSLMDLQPSSISDILSVRLASMPGRDHIHALYQVNGLKLGQTSLKFESSSSVSGQVYESESYPIQVFSPLRVFPSNITLVPGSTFQVSCSGGPHPQSTIEYSLEDTDKALVSTGGRVEAKNLGKTVLVARSIGYDKSGQRVVFSQDKALIHVISLTGVKIHSPLSRMIAGSEMPLYALGLSDQETPFSFGSAVPGIEFKWSVSNNEVVSVYSIYSEVGIEESSENNFCARVKAVEDGVVTLRMDVLVRDSAGNSLKAFSDEVQIQVFKMLALIEPKNENALILLSPNSQLKLKYNRFAPTKITYHISPTVGGDEPVVSVDGQGLLVASSQLGTATLTVIAVEDFGLIQYHTATIIVEDISYLMLKPTIQVKTRGWQLASVPVGFSIPFLVTYHDNVGRTFDAVTSQLKYRANRLDLTRISFGSTNNTLIVQALKPGSTVLKVWDSQYFVRPDYVKISSGIAIDPANTRVLVGDVICFGSPLLTNDGYSGSWSSENSVIAIHPVSGGAVALSTGTGLVTYYLSSTYSTSTQITVHPVDQVTISPGNLKYITNADMQKSYMIPVLMQSSTHYRSSNIIGRNCSAASHESFLLPSFQVPFFCDIGFNSTVSDIRAHDVFHVESGFNIAGGLYFCRLTAKTNSHDLSSLDTHVVLSVHPQSMDRGMEFTSVKETFPFLPPFSLSDQRLTLIGYQTLTFTISAAPSVQDCIEVTASDKTALDVMKPVRKSNGISYSIRLLDASRYRPDDVPMLHLRVACLKTKQLVQLPVYLKLFGMQYDSGQCFIPPPPPAAHIFPFDWLWMLTVAGVVVLVLMITYACKSFIMSRRGTVTTQPVFLNSSANASFSLSPSRLSPISSPSHHSSVYESLGRTSPKMWSMDSPPHQSLSRRRPPNVFQ